MQLPIHIVDAFTDTPFKGNPAAVIISEKWLSDAQMQSIALENNLSETAFVVRSEANRYHIRWFSPLTEVAFCGHASLASALVLFEQQNHSTETLSFYASAIGEFSITQRSCGKLQMDFPNTKPEPLSEIPDPLLNGLSYLPDELYRNHQALFVVYNSEQKVRTVERNNELLKTLNPLDVVVTSRSDNSNYDFISRYFWPANGGDEDPVTGSIHTGLAPLWAEILGKNRLVGYQASKRGGVVFCEVRGDRVLVSGNAVRYLRGTIEL